MTDASPIASRPPQRAHPMPDPRRPRVLHVVETWRPVASGYTARGWQIVSSQAATGVCEPFVLVSSRQHRHERQMADSPPGVPAAHVHVAAVSHGESRLRRVHSYHVDGHALESAIIQAAQAWQIDIIHCHWSSAIGAAARRAADRLGVALIAEVRFDLAGAVMSETVRRPVPGLETLLRLRFERHLLGADAVVAASHTLAGLIEATQPLCPGPVHVMANAIDRERFQPQPEAAARLRSSLDLDQAFVVGSTTNMLRYEGLDVLLDAVAALADELPQLVVVLVGGGTQHSALAASAARRGLPVRFVGRVGARDVPTYLGLFDLFVVPRRDRAVTRYASPIKLVEAQACGVPAVGSALGDIPHVLATGGGMTIPPDDPERLAAAIRRFALEPAMRAEAGRAALRWSAEQPDWQDLARAYGRLYSQTLMQRSRYD